MSRLADRFELQSPVYLLSGTANTIHSTTADYDLVASRLSPRSNFPKHSARRRIRSFNQSPVDPDQLYSPVDDLHELTNLAASHPLGKRFRAEVENKFDIPRIHREVLESQQSRLMMFEALKRGTHFPWDFQPLRKASEQYTRNHMSVTGRDQQSRFPQAPDIEGKRPN